MSYRSGSPGGNKLFGGGGAGVVEAIVKNGVDEVVAEEIIFIEDWKVLLSKNVVC